MHTDIQVVFTWAPTDRLWNDRHVTLDGVQNVFFIKSGLASVLFQAESLLQWKQFHTAKWESDPRAKGDLHGTRNQNMQL